MCLKVALDKSSPSDWDQGCFGDADFIFEDDRRRRKESVEKLQRCRNWTSYQQDNEPKPNAKVVKKRFKDPNINILELSSQSPDLHPIKNLKTRVMSRKLTNLTQLEVFAKEEWAIIAL
ncbi:unnamed protein product [Lepeophtheirus salmonis]|uniref:(salmon louse) hypothetical protein n=1 Tax=Lepeophtheirus salmonis TaxID=72036 RepID=A0A7R8HB61_LEPSM|nr:unnamed protein product [Lepeophtheirus salmonis]CAF2987266.1 unnamed protein product [Lepeophtheirus salmonis]